MKEQKDINRLAQKIQLEIMDAVHSLCKKNGLVYYMIGGTALGAVRHHGFIPWDVDIDIAMPRRDYNLFVEQYCKQLEPSYECKSYLNDKKHESPHALVVKRGSQIVFNFDEYNHDGEKREVYIDIMPLDYPPGTDVKKHRQEKAINIIKKLRALKMRRVYASDNWIKKITKHIVGLPFCLVSWRKINRCYDKIMSKYSDTDSGILCSMASHFSYTKQCIDKDIYGNPTLYTFEDRMYYGPEKIDSYLTRLYGNYMDLPSEESRNKLFYFIKDVSE